MMKNEDAHTSMERLKEAYNNTDIPPDVYRRIWSRIDTPRVKRRPNHPRRALTALAICWFGAVAVLFFFFGLELEKATEQRNEKPGSPRVVRANGGAEILQHGTLHLARSGMILPDNSTLHTQVSNAIIEIGRHRITVDKKTSLGIRRVTKQKLSFQLTKGAAEFHVAKLSNSATLTVQSGEVRVSVVGTIFRVDRAQHCTAVRVQEGRVKAEFGDQIVYISAGGHQEFCEERAQMIPSRSWPAPKSLERDMAPPPGEASQGKTLIEDGAIDIAKPPDRARTAQKRRATKRRAGHRQATSPQSTENDEDVDPGPSTEEQIIKQAHRAIAHSNRQEALSHLEAYITEYPSGLFVEEALFNAIRQSHWLKRKKDVVRYSGIFLEKDFSRGYKSIEIRILRAQALLELNESPEEAIASLEPVMSKLDTLSHRYRGQSMYLYILATHRAGQKSKCESHAKQYLDLFPEGRYRAVIEKLRDKMKTE